MLRLSVAEARRIAVSAQLLGRPRPTDLLSVVQRLAAVQVDQTSYVAPNAELVCWSRLGRRFEPGDLADARDAQLLVELRGFLRPAADLALYTAEMAAWPGPHPSGWLASIAAWVESNRSAREDILQALRSDGPLPAAVLPDRFAVDWRSSGWNNTKNVAMMLERLEERGEVAVSHRDGRQRNWDLAERVFPDVQPLPVREALRIRDERRLAALGVARARGPACPVEPQDVGEAGVDAVIEGVRGRWRVDPGYLDGPEPAGRTVLLSPLDRLVFDRKRMVDLFGFDYALEMYKPERSRRWGYFALPVLHGHELIGKVDAEADHRGGYLRVHAIHRDTPWSAAVEDEVAAELADLGRYLGLDVEVE